MRVKIALMACLVIAGCGARERSVADPFGDLPEWKDKTAQEMVTALGTPVEQYEYTVGKAATKNWNHGIIFSAYPKEKAEYRDVVIKEYAWAQGEYRIRACCHLVNNEWRVMGAMRIHKDVKF